MPSVEDGSSKQALLSLITGVERYNPSNTDKLVAFVDVQCAEGHYDLDANLAVLKLYQFNPSLTNTGVISKILLKALTQLPNPDFNLCLYLLNELVLDEPEIVKIMNAHELLETARYNEFWKEIGSLSELTSKVSGFADSIRKFIALNAGITFQKVNISILAEFLNLEGEALNAFIKSLGWTTSNNVVTLALNQDNQAKASVIQESVKFEQLTKIIGYSNAI